jgi:hypothetical protein
MLNVSSVILHESECPFRPIISATLNGACFAPFVKPSQATRARIYDIWDSPLTCRSWSWSSGQHAVSVCSLCLCCAAFWSFSIIPEPSCWAIVSRLLLLPIGSYSYPSRRSHDDRNTTCTAESWLIDRWWINAFFTGISPFLDPITRDKVCVTSRFSVL